MTEHIGDFDMARFRAGKLDRAEVEAIGAHVRACASCAERVWASRETRDSVEALARNASADARPRLWIVAATILAILGVLLFYAVWKSR